MCTVPLPPVVNPIAVNKYIISVSNSECLPRHRCWNLEIKKSTVNINDAKETETTIG